MSMPEVSINPEYSPKRETIIHYQYDEEGNLSMQTETVYEALKVVDRILSVRSVPHEEVDGLVDAGYQPESYFAKSVIMVLTHSENERVIAEIKAKLDAEREELA